LDIDVLRVTSAEGTRKGVNMAKDKKKDAKKGKKDKKGKKGKKK
jgi:hypothetical protein